MKITIKNYFKIIGEKLSKFRINTNKHTNDETRVIKVEFGNKKENNEKEFEENKNISSRKGAYIVDKKEIEKKKKVIKQSYKVLIGMVSLALVTSVLNIKYKDYLNLENYKEKEIDSIATVSSVEDFKIEETEEVAKANKVEEKVVTAQKTKVVETLNFSSPLKGEIQKMYSIDKVVYSKTLNQWKTHDGADISSQLGTDVKAIEKGVIESVYYDSFYGMTVEIEHINGYRSSYSNLDENVYVKVGQSVIKGEKIGKVGNTAVGESLDEPHLHFRLYLNNNCIDPTYIL